MHIMTATVKSGSASVTFPQLGTVISFLFVIVLNICYCCILIVFVVYLLGTLVSLNLFSDSISCAVPQLFAVLCFVIAVIMDSKDKQTASVRLHFGFTHHPCPGGAPPERRSWTPLGRNRPGAGKKKTGCGPWADAFVLNGWGPIHYFL